MNSSTKKKVVVVDLSVKQTSPAGSCVLSELIGLSEKYDVHLLASEVDENVKNYVTYHELTAPDLLVVLRYIVFSSKVKSKMKILLKQMGEKPIIQTTQGQFANCTISYPHFCHRAYLKKHWKNSPITGLRRTLRKLNHSYNARMEAKAFQNAEVIVVPSEGLKRELAEFYPSHGKKIKVIANPVDVGHFEKPIDFNREGEREKLGIGTDELVIAFAALGDFARKGLPELMRSLKELDIEDGRFKILVIGGKPEEIGNYKKQGVEMGIGDKLLFVGFKNDVRPFLWMSDIFSLPSLYEIFPLVCIQAAAAGLPLLVSHLHGVEEYLQDGKNGWLIERHEKSIAKVLRDIGQKKYDLPEMGSFALETVRQYDHESFREKWIDVYKKLE